MPRRNVTTLLGLALFVPLLAVLATSAPAAGESSTTQWSGSFTTEVTLKDPDSDFRDEVSLSGTVTSTGPGEGTVALKFDAYGWDPGNGCPTRMVSQSPSTINENVYFSEENGHLFLNASNALQTEITTYRACDDFTTTWTVYASDWLYACQSPGDPTEFPDLYLGAIVPDAADPTIVTARADAAATCTTTDPGHFIPTWHTTSDMTGAGREIQGNCEDSLVTASLTATPDTTGENNKVTFGVDASQPGSTYELRPAVGSLDSYALSPGRFTYTYPSAAEYTAGLIVRDSDGCTATDTVRLAAGAITAYAPTVFMHPDEKYKPGSAQEFIDRSQLVHWRPNCSGREPKYLAAGRDARSEGGVKQRLLRTKWLAGKGGSYSGPKLKKVLGKCPSRGTAKANGAPREYRLRHNDKWKNSSGFYLNLLNEKAWRKGDPSSARVYYTYKREHYIAYWIFWPYNKWTGSRVTEIHEGDWEHIVVRIGDNNLASRAAFYQHNCGAVQNLAWAVTPRDTPGSTHPALFAALGGHASYSRDPADVGANQSVDNCSVPLVGNDRIGEGSAWRPWEGKLRSAKLQPWWGFGGAWGDRSSKSTRIAAVDNYGPPSPGPSNVAVPGSWK